MPQYPVLQPDGNYAIWSTVVDHFVSMGLTEPKCHAELQRRYPSASSAEIDGAIHRAKQCDDEIYMEWPECLAWATYRHGENDADVVIAMQLTPPDIAQIASEILADTVAAI